MERSVKELAALFDVSVRTLHYYDAIGLLKPRRVSEAGYRYYGATEEKRLSQILFYRELEIPLSKIGSILSASDYDARQTLQQQKQLLLAKRQKLDVLLAIVTKSIEGEDITMEQFDFESIERIKAKYAKETEERYGATPAYRQSKEKCEKYDKAQWMAIQLEMDEIFRAFAKHLDDDPATEAVQALVAQWQAHITNHYYDCTKAILSSLGEMYVADERFTENIDRFGDGTAQLMRDAIRVYCSNDA